LIVTSSFAPAMPADMQRARMLAWELPHMSWDVEILCPDSGLQDPVMLDPDCAEFFPTDTPVHRVGAWLPALFRLLGIRTIGWRAAWPLYSRGLRLLRERRFDLVYFSTTQFILFCLGPFWSRATHVPFVVDIHDPWYQERARFATTRHGLKRRIGTMLAKVLERFVLRRADACVSVSPAYLETLGNRYARWQPRWTLPDLSAVV